MPFFDPIWQSMTSLKPLFPEKKILNGFFSNFGERRQVDAEKGTKSFALISAAFFELSRKSGRGLDLPPPPTSGARVKTQVLVKYDAQRHFDCPL